MLRGVIENKGIKVYIDFNSPWNNLYKKLKKIHLDDKPLNHIILKDIAFNFSQDGGYLFENIRNMVTQNNSLFDIYKACHIVSDASQELRQYLSYKIQNKEITDLNELDVASQIYNIKAINEVQKDNWDFDANVLNYELISFKGHEVLFTPSRIKATSIPNNLYLYETRYDDKHCGIISGLSTHVLVDFLGSIISSKELLLDKEYYLEIDGEKDIKFSKKNIRLSQYQNRRKSNHIER